ncbi:Enamine deaminase RidA, house cleaning of reactive enamine intermediates, YjgF/YER057c/UK114 family [Arboricoccus pini]|uniref:Enamine deaminase RidA, house cleaning of reactive enamine intermediates, YjgF/YER057c/UK114 family n=1 Tax=Arboricoccus pini TaxID=1963835 RepID=A0A212S2J8_9PROT|nr:RidA family protein [Arboricoccus pini]SNB79190.1 Enamine deaminase RidA, house cleaning of reactive enamine intermediates, YjgF/YER057c/UK114 family [Arboricoccus pini]
MSSSIETKLAELGLSLPAAAAPAANYVPWTVSGNIVHISGQLPMQDGKVAVLGKLGESVEVDAGQEAAKICALNILAQLKAACGGDLGRARRCLRLGGFVNATPNFSEHPKVINGASDLIVAAMGDGGRHARFAVGVAGLPFGAAVEVDGTFEIA